MNAAITPILSPGELLQISPGKEVVLVDTRIGPNSKERYAAAHLKGALYVDLDTDLADIKPNPAEGGRHPLPSIDKFAAVLQRLGITPSTHVIIYDDKNGANPAARLWWMLRAIGHKKVQVIDGGYDAAVKAGYPVSNEKEFAAAAAPYPATSWGLPVANMAGTAFAAADPHSIVIDVRDRDRYAGRTEPIDLIAGHIPGAINLPFTGNLDEKGFYLSPQQLKDKYEKELANTSADNIIVHCGSGVTACHTLLAMDYAGLPIPKLYVGSWSEWSRNDMPIATEK